MAAGSTVTAMKTAVRRGAAAATLGQARRRYLIGGRPLASSKPRMNGRDEMPQLSKDEFVPYNRLLENNLKIVWKLEYFLARQTFSPSSIPAMCASSKLTFDTNKIVHDSSVNILSRSLPEYIWSLFVNAQNIMLDKMAQLNDFIEKLDFKTFETKFYETTASGAKAGKNLAAASVSPLRSIYDFLEVRSMALPHEWIWRCNLAGIFFASLVAGNVAADEWGKRTNTKQKLLLDEAGKQEAAREGFLKS